MGVARKKDIHLVKKEQMSNIFRKKTMAGPKKNYSKNQAKILPFQKKETISSNYLEIIQTKKQICEMAARTILRALDAKDHYTFGHSTRVAFYSLQLGKELKLKQEELYDLELAALFHDIGKIGVPDAVLLKPERLSDEEFLKMKAHPEKSWEILCDFDEFQNVATIARHHHERYDGRGYPHGLKGENIPLFSRIVLIADTFDAVTSSRPYRKGLSYEFAFNELQEFAGTQFDQNLVKHFISAMKKDEKQVDRTFTLKIIAGIFEKNAA